MITFGPVRVLVIDDNLDYVFTTCKLLEMLGYEAHGTTDSRNALVSTKALQPHVILLDLAMPYQDGLETLRQLRGEPAIDQTTIIMASAFTRPKDREAALAAGANHYLTKPFDSHDLCDVIRSAVISR